MTLEIHATEYVEKTPSPTSVGHVHRDMHTLAGRWRRRQIAALSILASFALACVRASNSRLKALTIVLQAKRPLAVAALLMGLRPLLNLWVERLGIAAQDQITRALNSFSVVRLQAK